MHHLRRSVVLGAALAMVLAGIVQTAPASANGAGVSVANFAESRGCSPGIAGTTRPNVSRSGTMSVNDQIRGPWGDMFGRTYYQVAQSLVDWRLPGSNKTMRVHERALPALQQAEGALNYAIATGQSYYVYSAVSWVWRTVGGTLRPSTHATATGFDINPASNPYSADNYLRTNLPDWFVSAFVDAGFCWGGDWVDVKDAMHFSFSGAGQLPGASRPAPYPAVTSSTNYQGAVVTRTSAIAPKSGASVTLADITGEGAPDIVQVTDSGRVDVAGAVGGYQQFALRATTATGSSDSLLGDYDLDGRADVWVPDRSGSTVAFDVYTWASGFSQAERVATAVPSDSTNVMLGMYDDDFLPDVYSYDGASFSVYGSTLDYGSLVGFISVPQGASLSWRYVTGDHDLDGKSDIYAVSTGQNPSVRISTAAGGSASFQPSIAVGSGSAVEFGDYDGDGRQDMFVLTGNSLKIALGGNSFGEPDAWFQSASSSPADAGPECTGESCASIGYVDSQGIWSLADSPRTEASLTSFYYGNPGDIPFSGDWNCDGVDTPGLYRASDGFVYLRNSNTQGVADYEFFFGNPGDVPLIGDFNGDGCETVSIFRPGNHRIYIMNELGQDGGGLGSAEYDYAFGDAADIPFTGDFDADGVDEIGLMRPSTSEIFLKWDLGPGTANLSFTFGEPGDIPFSGDWNGDGRDTIATFRPSDGNWYIKLANSSGAADHIIGLHPHGGATNPIVGHFE